MIAVLILSNSGDVIYQSPHSNRHQPSEGNIIRFLPLLLTKDLFKANFHDRIHYVHNRRKTIAFSEKHGLLYIAWTSRGSIPVHVLHQHLHIIDRLLLFTFGPQWHTKVDTLTTSRALRWRGSIPDTAIASCLSRLSSLVAPLPPLYSADMLCCVEQVELQEDLRTRLTDNLRECCDTAFSQTNTHAAAASALRFTSLFATPPKKILTLSPLKHHQHSLNDTQQRPQMWSDAFLFARDKLVVRCSRVAEDASDGHQDDEIPSETLYFLKNMASEYAGQAAAREDFAEQRNRPSASSSKSHCPDNNTFSVDKKPVSATSPESSPTPQPSSSEATSQKSSTSYIYDSSSLSAPFKVKEKSTSSVTVASSNCSTPSLSWSSPPILMHNQLLSRLSRRSLDVDDQRRFSSSSRHIDQQSSNLPRNATIFHPPITIIDTKSPDTTSDSCLSTSIPLEISTFGLSKATRRQSAPTSPAPRSRRDSSAERLSARTSLRNMFSTFLQAEHVDDEVAPNEGKILSRWIKFNQNSAVLCVILLVHLGDGLCATVVFKDDQQERDEDTLDGMPDRMTSHGSVKTLRVRFQDHLKDFASFLMTKAITHFSILSFITVYPGLLHFIHTHNGVMLSPRIIDLTYLNQDHELLLEIGQKYQEWNSCTGCEQTTKWGWPSIGKLQNLAEEMIRVARLSNSQECQVVKMSHQGFQCAYLRGYDGEYLLAMYFSFIPLHVVLEMHERLFQDVSQRLLLTA